MALPSDLYRNPSDAVESVRYYERKAADKLRRKAYRQMWGCRACVRYHQSLHCCTEGQRPHDGGFCQYWWGDNSTVPAPEINRNV